MRCSRWTLTSLLVVALIAVSAPACDSDDAAADGSDGVAGGAADVADDTTSADSADRSGGADPVSGDTPCTPLLCEDGNPCTDDSCSEVGTCLHALTANGTQCGCDEEGVCSDGSCLGNKQVCTSHLDCDDSLSCTIGG